MTADSLMRDHAIDRADYGIDSDVGARAMDYVRGIVDLRVVTCVERTVSVDPCYCCGDSLSRHTAVAMKECQDACRGVL